jgi:hypothetical protein
MGVSDPVIGAHHFECFPAWRCFMIDHVPVTNARRAGRSTAGRKDKRKTKRRWQINSMRKGGSARGQVGNQRCRNIFPWTSLRSWATTAACILRAAESRQWMCMPAARSESLGNQTKQTTSVDAPILAHTHHYDKCAKHYPSHWSKFGESES